MHHGLTLKILFTVGLLSANAYNNSNYAQSQKINLNIKNGTIEEVFQAIEEQSEFIFYSNITKLNEKVDLKIRNAPIDKVLKKTFVGFDQDAMDDINVIRLRAQIPIYDLGSLPVGKTVFELILQERRQELVYEGHRIFDVFRNGLTMDRNYPGTHSREDILSVAAADNEVILFIP